MESINKKIIVLYGPPGVGKSTLVGLAKKKGICAYDIEKLGHTTESRRSALKLLLKKEKSPYLFFGAADMKPPDFPKGTTHILLLPAKEVYFFRMEKRDKEHLRKAKQNGLVHYGHFVKAKQLFDVIIDSEMTASDTLKCILKIINYKL